MCFWLSMVFVIIFRSFLTRGDFFEGFNGYFKIMRVNAYFLNIRVRIGILFVFVSRRSIVRCIFFESRDFME